jgi:uncharacterized protein (TIGR03435 family)
LEFDVASVKLSAVRESFTIVDYGGPGSSTPGNWSCEYCNLRKLLSLAFAIDDSQISGPPWMPNQRFHIRANLPPATTGAQFREMLRNLLIGRFALVAHLESRVVARYELAVAGSGHKLRKSVERVPPAQQTPASKQPALDADGFPKLGPPSGEPEILTIMGRTSMFFPRTAMKDLAEELSFKSGRLVVDTTGLAGEYDIALRWRDDDSGPSLIQALRDQLGLRLVEKKGPVDFLVVEHVEKLPTDN